MVKIDVKARPEPDETVRSRVCAHARRVTAARAYCTGTARWRLATGSPCVDGTLGAARSGLLIRGSLVRSQLGEPLQRAVCSRRTGGSLGSSQQRRGRDLCVVPVRGQNAGNANGRLWRGQRRGRPVAGPCPENRAARAVAAASKRSAHPAPVSAANLTGKQRSAGRPPASAGAPGRATMAYGWSALNVATIRSSRPRYSAQASVALRSTPRMVT